MLTAVAGLPEILGAEFEGTGGGSAEGAASSLDSKPTSRFGSVAAGKSLRASDRTVGPIFAAQPQVRASPVRVFFLPKNFMNYSFDPFA